MKLNRCGRILGAAVFVVPAVAVGWLVGVATPAQAQAEELCTAIFEFAGAGEQEFVVPAGVETIFVDALGAQGGALPAAQNPGTGGLGAQASGDVAVIPGQSLTVVVGGKADDVPGPPNAPETSGGFLGGGDGGAMVGTVHGGAGGGGFSGVQPTTLEWLVVAGAGGGGSHGGSGGDGGFLGEPGTRGPTASGTTVPGGGGGQAAGGVGGAGGGSGNGLDGAQFQGGAGGGGTQSVDAGGGGGGGFFGGGGGGGGTATAQGGGSGGGGGSSTGPDGFEFATGVREGDGEVRISYEDPNCTDLSITKVPSQDVVDPDEEFSYTLVITNVGPNPATGVTVTDPLAPELVFVDGECEVGTEGPGPSFEWAIGEIASGDTVECTVTAFPDSTQIPPTGLAIENTASVAGDQDDPTPANNEDTATIFVPPISDLAITKTPSVTTANLGATVEYTLEVENLGPNDATGVTVTDDLNLQDVTYVADDCGVGDVDPWIWDVGALPSGDSASCVITVIPLSVGAVVNAASVEGDQPDPDPDNNMDEAIVGVVNEADLAINKTPSDDQATLGATVDYTIVVENLGPAGATGVTVTDILNAQDVAYIGDDCGVGDADPWVWVIGDLAAGDVDAGIPGESATCVITVMPLSAGTLVNTATVEGDQDDPNPDDNTDDATVEVLEVDLAIAKTATLIDDTTIEYALVVENLGAGDATGVTVADDLPAEVVYASDTCGGTNVPPWTWEVGDLDAGESVACTITVEAQVTGVTIENTATVAGDQDETDPDNNVDSAVVEMPAPTTTTTQPTTTTTQPTTTTTLPAAGVGGGATTTTTTLPVGRLPSTGSELRLVIALATLLGAVGVGAIAVARRRACITPPSPTRQT